MGLLAMDFSEEAAHLFCRRAWQCEEESTVEEPVGLFARRLGYEGTAVTSRAMKEVLGVAGRAHRADRVR